MSEPRSQPKRHHYLPESYLCGFTAGGNRADVFWVYDIQRRQLRAQTPKNTGLQTHYYSLMMPDGSKDTRLENILSQIESHAIAIIKKVEVNAKLTNEERSQLAYFLALLKCRGPDFETDVNTQFSHIIKRISRMSVASEERAQESIDTYEASTGKKLGVSAKELSEFVLSDRYTIKINRRASLLMMLQLAPKLAEDFHIMDWSFCHAPATRSFVTTDAPYHITPPPNYDKFPKWASYGHRHRGTKKMMPLSAKVVLVMFDPGQVTIHQDVSEVAVDEMNRCLALDANRFLIGRDEALVRSLVEFAEASEKKHGFKWGGSKLRIY